LRARSNNHTFDPETDEGQERTECHHYVRIIGTRFLYHATQFRVAIRADHGKESLRGIKDEIKFQCGDSIAGTLVQAEKNFSQVIDITIKSSYSTYDSKKNSIKTRQNLQN